MPYENHLSFLDAIHQISIAATNGNSEQIANDRGNNSAISDCKCNSRDGDVGIRVESNLPGYPSKVNDCKQDYTKQNVSSHSLHMANVRCPHLSQFTLNLQTNMYDIDLDI